MKQLILLVFVLLVMASPVAACGEDDPIILEVTATHQWTMEEEIISFPLTKENWIVEFRLPYVRRGVIGPDGKDSAYVLVIKDGQTQQAQVSLDKRTGVFFYTIVGEGLYFNLNHDVKSFAGPVHDDELGTVFVKGKWSW